jgi:hypothetical protein
MPQNEHLEERLDLGTRMVIDFGTAPGRRVAPALSIELLTVADCVTIARLRPTTKGRGPSSGVFYIGRPPERPSIDRRFKWLEADVLWLIR